MASKPMGLNGSTLGLFGFGKIGRAVAGERGDSGCACLRSIEALQRMSCHNLTDCLTGNRAHAFKIINGVSI